MSVRKKRTLKSSNRRSGVPVVLSVILSLLDTGYGMLDAVFALALALLVVLEVGRQVGKRMGDQIMLLLGLHSYYFSD